MAFYKNKHVILAMFVAPLLSIIAYFGVDYVVSEKPHSAQVNDSYRLLASSNCRYKSGSCTLKNGDVVIMLQVKRINARQAELYLNSELPVQLAVISYVEDSIESEPITLQANQSQKNSLQTKLSIVSPEKSYLRLALKIYNTTYYAETPAVFVDYQTSYPQDNFSQ